MTHEDALAARLTAQLAGLGDTPDAVAAALRARGIQGLRHTVYFLNPIVRFVHSLIGPDHAIDVAGGDRLQVRQPAGPVEVPLPSAVREFLVRFDAGTYPELQEPVGPRP